MIYKCNNCLVMNQDVGSDTFPNERETSCVFINYLRGRTARHSCYFSIESAQTNEMELSLKKFEKGCEFTADIVLLDWISTKRVQKFLLELFGLQSQATQLLLLALFVLGICINGLCQKGLASLRENCA